MRETDGISRVSATQSGRGLHFSEVLFVGGLAQDRLRRVAF